MLPQLLIAILLQAPAMAINVKGHVEMKIGPTPIQLTRFVAVPDSATVITYENSFASLRLFSGSLVRMGPNTQLLIKQLNYKKPVGKRHESLSVKVGHIWAGVLRLIGSESKFEIETPNAIAGVRGTSFFVSATPEASNFVVGDGSLAIAIGEREVLLDEKGASVTIGPDGFIPLSKISDAELKALFERVGGAAAVNGVSYPTIIAATTTSDEAAREAWRNELMRPDLLIDTPFLGTTSWSPSLTTTNLTVQVNIPTAN
ncbi:MAG: FecR domain-containing protein [Deltaproteobacteria bacterium]|nr:FecR domain-containing protein [Deltaproteobacteria bacterium]